MLVKGEKFETIFNSPRHRIFPVIIFKRNRNQNLHPAGYRMAPPGLHLLGCIVIQHFLPFQGGGINLFVIIISNRKTQAAFEGTSWIVRIAWDLYPLAIFPFTRWNNTTRLLLLSDLFLCLFHILGRPTENRTPLYAVKGRRPNR